MSLDYVGMLERGERLPSLQVACKFADLFGITVASMLASPTIDPEPWLAEVGALLRSVPDAMREILVEMLRAAAARTPGRRTVQKRSGVRARRT